MLAKSKTSALILAFVFFASFMAAYAALDYPRLLPGLNFGTIILMLALNCVCAFLVSRSGIFMGLEEEAGFGLRGLLHWLTCGVILGILDSALNNYLQPLIGNSFLRPITQLLGGVIITYIAYWIPFQRNVFKMVDATGFDFLTNRSRESIFLMLGGLFVVAVGFLFVFRTVGGTVKSSWLAVGLVFMGLSALLLGALNRQGHRDGFENRLLWVEFLLFGVGMISLVVGLVL